MIHHKFRDTEIQRLKEYQSDPDQIVKRVEISTANDERTCLECSELNGKIFTIKEALDQMPIPDKCSNSEDGCRCTYLPVIED